MPHVEAPRYTWVCQYCGLSSPGGTLHCANCGFPAHTSAFELERVKRLGSVREFLAEHHLQKGELATQAATEEGTCRCGCASARCWPYSVATRIGLEKRGIGCSNSGRIPVASLDWQVISPNNRFKRIAEPRLRWIMEDSMILIDQLGLAATHCCGARFHD